MSFVKALSDEGNLDFWTIARRLSKAGQITPLASRGIVGQLTSAYVVYTTPRPPAAAAAARCSISKAGWSPRGLELMAAYQASREGSRAGASRRRSW